MSRRVNLLLFMLMTLLLCKGASGAGASVRISNHMVEVEPVVSYYYYDPPTNVSILNFSHDPDNETYTCWYNISNQTSWKAEDSCVVEFPFTFGRYNLHVRLNDSHLTTDTIVNLSIISMGECVLDYNLTSEIVNGSGVRLSWDMPSGMMNTDLAYISDITDPQNASRVMFNFTNKTKVYGLAGENWTDTDPPKERYYKLVAGGCESKRTIAYRNISLRVNSSVGFNLISTPMTPRNTSLGAVLRPIFEDLDIAYWFSNSEKKFYSFRALQVGNDWFTMNQIKNLTPYNAYWVKVLRDTYLPLTGALHNITNITMTPEFNLVSMHMTEGDRRVETIAEGMAEHLDKIYYYDNAAKKFSGFTVVSANPYLFTKNFDELLPFRGYYTKMTNTTRLLWPED